MTSEDINSGKAPEQTLNSLIDNILSERGLDTLSDRTSVGGFLPSGVSAIDDLVGGFPRESITEIYSRPGCIDGDMMVSVRGEGWSKGTVHSLKLSTLFKRFHGQKYRGHHGIDRSGEILYARSLDESSGEMGWSRIVDVIDSGIKEVYELEFASGRILRATPDHLVWTDCGWAEVGSLSIGDCVGYNPTLPVATGKKKKPYDHEISVKYHPSAPRHVVNGCTYYRMAEYRFIYEAKMNGMSLDEYVNLLNNYDGRKIWTIPKGYHIDHINGDHSDNRIDNLQMLSVVEHGIKHTESALKQIAHKPEFDEIVSVKSAGERHVYDVSCDGNHSFLANRYIVHNCGKTTLMMYVAETQNYRTLYIDAEHRYRNETNGNIVVLSENIVENIEAIVNDALDSQSFDLIVVDSVASMVPQKFFDDEYANDMGLKARAMAMWMQRVPGHLRASNGTALVFINQMRDTMNAFGIKTFTPGGHALTYACSLRLELQSPKANDIMRNGVKVGQKVLFKVTKNTQGPDRLEGEYKAIFNEGKVQIDSVKKTVATAKNK